MKSIINKILDVLLIITTIIIFMITFFINIEDIQLSFGTLLEIIENWESSPIYSIYFGNNCLNNQENFFSDIYKGELQICVNRSQKISYFSLNISKSCETYSCGIIDSLGNNLCAETNESCPLSNQYSNQPNYQIVKKIPIQNYFKNPNIILNTTYYSNFISDPTQLNFFSRNYFGWNNRCLNLRNNRFEKLVNSKGLLKTEIITENIKKSRITLIVSVIYLVCCISMIKSKINLLGKITPKQAITMLLIYFGFMLMNVYVFYQNSDLIHNLYLGDSSDNKELILMIFGENCSDKKTNIQLIKAGKLLENAENVGVYLNYLLLINLFICLVYSVIFSFQKADKYDTAHAKLKTF